MHPAGALKKMRGANAVSATLTLLAGCAAPSANFSRAVPPPPAAAPLTQSQSGDLLYVVNIGDSTVGVYEYPAGIKTGSLSGFSHPRAACTDAAGNVFIANTGAHDVVEYAHGGSQPQRTLTDGNYDPAYCAADPLTGNLAVANDQSGKQRTGGSIAVYRRARGMPQYFTGLHAYLSCAFDDHGDLFAVGEYDSNYYLQELPRGAAAFTTIHVHALAVRYVGWDGKDVIDEVPETHWSAIYRLKISKTQAHLAGVTTVSRKGTAFFDRPRVIVTGQTGAAFFNYPPGSGPTRKVFDVQDPIASVVSRAAPQ